MKRSGDAKTLTPGSVTKKCCIGICFQKDRRVVKNVKDMNYMIIIVAMA